MRKLLGEYYTTDAGMTNYIWTVSPGGVITAGGTGNESVTVTWTSTGAKTVSVNYTNGNGCTAAAPTAYNVTVNPLPVPTISGNASACITSTGNVYTSEVGMTGYTWSVSAGGTITAGGGVNDNSVTITWNTAGAQSVSVNYINGNGCTAASPTVYPVTVNPLPVPTITGNASVCQNSTGNVYSTEAGMTAYTWAVSVGGTVTGGGGANDNTVTISWGTTGPQSVSVIYTNGNGCTAPAATVYPVTVNVLPVPTITGPAPVCRNEPGNVYTTEASMTNYIWTVSAGGIITAGGNGTNSVTITWTVAGAQSVSVNYNNANGCTAATPTVYPVTVNPLPVPTITGNAAACVNSTGNTYTTEPGMSGYTWVVPAGGSITSGGTATDNSVTVTWTTIGLKTITVNYVDGFGCTATSATAYNVTVNSLPAPAITGNAAACASSAGNLYTTEASMTNYLWNISAGGAVTAGGTPADNSVTVTWITPGPQTVSVNYTNSNGCTAASATVKPVTVNPLPVPIITGPSAPCQNSTGNVYTTEIGMANYIWTVSAGGTITAGGTTSNNVVVVTWNTTGPQTVSVVYTNGNGCTAAAATVYPVNVNVLPVPTISGPTPICANITGNLYSTEAGMTNYLWTVSPGGTITAGGTINDNSVTVTWTTAGARTVSVNYTNGNGCTATIPTEYNVTVNQLPAGILSGGETICPTETSLLKVDMSTGTSPFEIDIQNYPGLTITGYISGADIPVTPGATTTYKLLRIRDANGCQVTSLPYVSGQATVTVRALPSITSSPVNKSICENGVVSFSVAATGSDLSYQWYVDQGIGFVPLGDTAVYFGANQPTLNLYGATRNMTGYVYHAEVSGCSVTETSTDAILTVNTIPEIVIQPKDTTICSTTNAAFSVSATGTGINYQWQVKMGAASFANVTDVGPYAGSNSDNLTLTGVPGTYNNYLYRVIITGSCGVPVYSNIVVLRVNVPPVVTAQPANKAICDGGGPVYFIANGSGMIDSLRWQVNSGSGWSDIYDDGIYSGATTQQLALIDVPLGYNNNQYRLALKAFCATVHSNGAILTVNSLPVINFASDPINACGGVAQVITPVITGGSGTWTQHTWTGDVGPLNNYFIQSPTFKSQIPGTYNLNYRVRDNNLCYGNKDVVVVVDAPDATFTQDISYGCTPLEVTFAKDMTGVASFTWDFDDGTTNSVDANPVHTFTNLNTSSIEYYNVKLTVVSPGGCQATYTQLITVYPSVDATFTSDRATICSSESVTFSALPGAGTYHWDYGDGVNGPGANGSTHIFINNDPLGNPVVYTVTLTTTSFYGCTDVKTLNITVMPKPLPDFVAAPSPQVYNPLGNTFNFTNQTNPGTWTFTWTFGDGSPTSSATSPSHTYNGVGTYSVILKADNGICNASVTKMIDIVPEPPVANFDNVPDGCTPLYVNINNTTVNANTPGTTFRWDFGDGNYSTAKNPTYTYFTSGLYRIELTVTGPGGVSVYSQVVEAFPSPKAYFEVAPTFVFVNDEKVRCFNLSTNADSYLWEFGDGDTSKIKEPFHKYMESGIFDITLWAYSDNGCSDKYILSPGVTVEPAGEVRFSTVFTPNKEGPIDRTDLPTGGVEIDQFFFPPIREKVINYKLQIFNRLGVLIFQSNDINIPWNGYYKGKLCSQGVYVWYVEGKYANGQPFKKVGDVTLLH